MRSRAAGAFAMVILMAVVFCNMAWGVNGEGTSGEDIVANGDEQGAHTGTATMQSNNAAYLNSYWFNGEEPLTDEQMIERITELERFHIQYQLADIGILISGGGAKNGSLPAAGYRQLARWIKLTHETAPGQKIIAVVNDGNRVTWRNGKKTANPNFGNATYTNNLKAAADKLVNQGLPYAGGIYKADGIQLDIEGFLPNDRVLVDTAATLRAVLPDTAIYSIASPADPAVWSDEYVSEMAGIFNMLNPMMYDQLGWGSPIDSPEAYRQFWVETTLRYARAIAVGSHPETRLIPTMPAYGKKVAEDGTVYHDPAIENIANSAEGLREARAQLALERSQMPALNANGVHGAGIFWWSSFISAQPDQRDEHDYAADRQWWMEQWVGQE